MRFSRKSIILSGLAVFFAVSLLIAGVSLAAGKNEIIGWAWSDTAGNISFNSKNCDTDDNGVIDNTACGNVGSSVTPYEVAIASNGYLEGYAWSDTVGTISFNRAETGNPPSDDACVLSSCIAKVDSTNKVVGWARAISACNWDGSRCVGSGAGSNTGGWDGWIRFSCPKVNKAGTSCPFNSYSVTLNTIPNARGFREFLGWAWGGKEVAGSISFNHKNCDANEDGQSDGSEARGTENCPALGTPIAEYQVEKGDPIISLPTAQFSCDPYSCGIDDSDPCKCYSNSLAFLKLTNESEVVSEITQSDWSVDGVLASSNQYGNYSLKLSPGTYNVGLAVTNSKGTATTSKMVTFIKGMEADFSCKTSEGAWVNCSNLNLKVDQGTVIYLRDDSSVPFYSTASQGGTINSRVWTNNGSADGFSNQGGSFTTTTLKAFSTKIGLTITDSNSAGRTMFKEYNISPRPLPRWKESMPF